MVNHQTVSGAIESGRRLAYGVVVGRLFQRASKYKWRIFWGCLLLLGTNATMLAIPELMGIAVDGVRAGESVDYLRGLAYTMVLYAIAGAVFRTLSRVHIFFSARDVEMDLRREFYQHLSLQDPDFFATHSAGDLMSRATNDLTQIRLLLGPGILNIVNTVIAYAMALPLMIMISAKLTAIIFSLYPLAFLLMRHIGKLLYLRNQEQQRSLGDVSAFVRESLAGMHVVRAYSIEKRRQQGFEKHNEATYEANIKLAWLRSGMFRVVISLATMSTLLAVYFGSLEVLAGTITLGDVVALVEYMALLAWPTFALGWVLSVWQRGASSMARLEEILGHKPQIASGTQTPTSIEPTIAATSLTVSYDDREVLSDVSLDVPAGTTLGIVGPIGSGKSTLIKSLMRLVDIPARTVAVGGYDVTDLSLPSLRAAFGYTSQATILFSRSLRENVAFGRPDATNEEIRAALDDAAFDVDDPALPNGLDTMIGERGIALSGGQKQRAAIARALLVDPAILILDDSLSAVDAETEARIVERLRARRHGKTTVIVTHRPSAVAHADQIIVLKAGRLVERGTHDHLRDIDDGFYADMVRRQELEEAVQ